MHQVLKTDVAQYLGTCLHCTYYYQELATIETQLTISADEYKSDSRMSTTRVNLRQIVCHSGSRSTYKLTSTLQQ